MGRGQDLTLCLPEYRRPDPIYAFTIQDQTPLPCNRVVNHVKPRKNAMQNGPEDRFIYRPRYCDRKRRTKTDSGSNDLALVHIYSPVGHNGLLGIVLSDRRIDAELILPLLPLLEFFVWTDLGKASNATR